jgi:polysaccharide pyruvyl transferase WcaK-like protein
VTGDRPVIGVWGHYADANLGDDACPTALLHHLQLLLPSARFVLFCRFPEIAQARWGWPAHPVRRLSAGQHGPWQPPASLGADGGVATRQRGWRARVRGIGPLRVAIRVARALVTAARALPAECRFLWQSYRQLRDVDLLVVTGSNPLFDFFGGIRQFPYTVWKWAALARFSRTRLAFVSVGAGPIVSARSGRLLARALRRADYVSFRDEGSRRLMRQYGFDGPDAVYPDLAHSLPFSPPPRAPSARLRIGINPMIVHHGVFWPVRDAAIHRRYVESVAALATALVAHGNDVFFYGTQKDDRVTAEEIQSAMQSATASSPPPLFVMPPSVDDLLDLCASTDLLVTTRFHGAVFGVLTARPTLAICYQQKTREVLAAAGLGAYAIDFEHVGPERLRTVFDGLCAERTTVEARLRQHTSDLGAQLHRQYQQVVALLRREPRHAVSVPPARASEVPGTRS